MMFDDEDPTQATAQELYAKAQTFVHTVTGGDVSDWYKLPVAKLPQYGPLGRCGISLAMKFEMTKQNTWDTINSSLSDITKMASGEFKDQLQTWINDVYPTLEEGDRHEKSEDIQWAITSLLGFSTAWNGALESQWRAAQFTYSDDSKANLPSFLENLTKLSVIVFDLIDLFNSTGYIHSHWFRWAFIRLYPLVNRDSLYSSFNDDKRPARVHPQAILQTPYYKYVLDTIATNPAALFRSMEDCLFGVLSGLLVSDMLYLASHQEDAAAIRPHQIANLEAVMAISDHFTSLCTNIQYSSYVSIANLMGLVAWLCGFLACNAIKAKEMNYPYDQFANRIANYILWLGRYCTTSGYAAANFNVLNNVFTKFDCFNRQICLSKKSLEYITPVYDYLMTIEFAGTDYKAFLPSEPSKLRPKLPDLIAIPSLRDLEKWGGEVDAVANSCEGSNEHRAYWNKKWSQANTLLFNNSDDLTVLIDQWTNIPEVTSPMDLFQAENKKSVDFDKVFGKIQYVTGGTYDFRVKIITAGSADVEVTMVTNAAKQPGHGEWKVVQAFPDHRIKVVKAGTYDFTVKLK